MKLYFIRYLKCEQVYKNEWNGCICLLPDFKYVFSVTNDCYNISMLTNTYIIVIICQLFDPSSCTESSCRVFNLTNRS